jgi:hypothetical protein
MIDLEWVRWLYDKPSPGLLPGGSSSEPAWASWRVIGTRTGASSSAAKGLVDSAGDMS